MLGTGIYRGEFVYILDSLYSNEGLELLINYGGPRWIKREDLEDILLLGVG